jgi:outer membrane protein insertion porin family
MLATLLLLVLAAAAGALGVRSRLDGWVRAALEREVSRRFGGELSFGSFGIRLSRLEAEFADARLRLPADNGAGLQIEVVRGRARLGRSSLLGAPAGRLQLAELVLERPSVVWHRVRQHGTRGTPTPRRSTELRVGRLEVSDGRVMLSDREIPWSLSASEVELQGAWDRRQGALRGSLSLRLDVLRRPFVRPLPLSVHGRFRLRRHDVELDDLVAEGDGLQGRLDANVRLADALAVVGRGEAQVDMDRLRPLLDPALPRLGGRVAGTFGVEAGRGPLSVRGEFRAESPRFGELSASRAQATARYTAGLLELVDLKALAFDGEVSGSAEVRWSESTRFRLDLDGRRLDAAALFERVRVPVPAASRVDASLALTGNPARRSSWTGGGSFVARAAPTGRGRVPVGGRGELTFGEGTLTLNAALDMASARFAARAEVDLDEPQQSRLAFDGSTLNARDTQLALRGITESLDLELPELARRRVGGSGPFRASIRMGESPELVLGLDLSRGQFGRRRFDRAELELHLREGALHVPRLALRNGRERLTGSVHGRLEPLSVEQIDLQAHELDPGWLVSAAELPIQLTGRLDAELRMRLEADGRRGGGRVEVAQGTLFGEPFDRLVADVSIDTDAVYLSSLSTSGAVADAFGSAVWWTASDRWSLTLARAVVDLGELRALASRDWPVHGELELSGGVRAAAGSLDGDLELSGRGWAYAGRTLGRARGEARFVGDGLVAWLDGGEQSDWSADLWLGWSDDLPFEARVAFDETLIGLGEGDPFPVWARLTGEATLDGPLGDAERIRLHGRVDRAEFHTGAERFETAGPVDVDRIGGRFVLSPIRVVGPGTEVTIRSGYDSTADRLEATVDGRVGLGLLAAGWPEMRADGDVSVSLEARGPLAAPEVRGTLKCGAGRVRWLGFPQSVEQLSFGVELDGREAVLTEAKGRFGNGEIRLEGRATLSGLGLESYRLRVNGANVRVMYPAGFRGVYEGEVTLEGGPRGTTLGGGLDVLLGAYERNFERSGQAGRAYASADDSGPVGDVLLDLRIAADGNVWVRNDLVDIESSFDFHVGGSLRRPELTGRVWLKEGGELVYRDVEYRLTSGSLDFVELDRLNPYLTLRAETTVKSYTVFLRVEGTLDRFEYELTSDPTLQTQDIIALLATGNTLEEMTGTKAGGTRFTGDLAANYFSGALTAPFTRQLQRLTGLEKVRIDPLLTEGESDPTTRLTIGEEVADDVFVIFSTDMSRGERQLYQVEWQATRRFRLTVERDTQGGVGGDVRYTKRFWWADPPPAEETARRPSEQARAGPVSPTVASVRLEGVQEEDRARLYERLPLRAGGAFSRSTMFAGVESLKRYYLRKGFIECRVDADSADAPPGVDVLYRVVAGPSVELEFVGTTRKEERRLRGRLEQLWIDSVFSEEMYDDAVDRVREFFHERGHYAADVRHEIVDEAAQRRVTLIVDRGKPVGVERVTIRGARHLREERIRTHMLTRPSSMFSRRVLVPRVMDEDVAALRAMYRDEGFLDVRIAPPRVRLSIAGDSAEVELEIEEGPRSTVAQVDFPGDLPFGLEEMAGWAGLEPGQVFSPAGLLQAESRLRAQIDRRGYPDARVLGRFATSASGVLVRFEIDPGGLKRVGDIRLVGNRLTRSKVIRRELELEQGDVISREALLRSQHQLYQLGIFREVRLSYAPLASHDPTLHELEVAVTESAPLTTSVGLGYDTEADGRVSFSLGHENVGGADRGLSVQGKSSGLERRLQVVGTEPRLFNHRLAGLVSLGWEETEENDFTEERVTTAFRMARRLTPRWAAFARYSFQNVILSDVEISPAELEEEKLVDGRFGDFGIGFLRDTRDNPFLTRKGSNLTLGTRLFAKQLGSEFTFVKNDVGWSVVRPVGRGTALASAVRVGLAFPYGRDGAVPISEAYFAGGDSTLRGFPRDEVGPASGGEALLLLNEEFRFPVWGALKGVVFYDAGNVYDETDDFDPTDLRHVLGAGLRLETPIGPLRVEYGGKLDREPGESTGELFFSIGAAF